MTKWTALPDNAPPRFVCLPASDRRFPNHIGVVVGESPRRLRVAVQIMHKGGRHATHYRSMAKAQAKP